MEKRIIVLNALLFVAILAEQGFKIGNLFSGAVFCSYYFLNKFEGMRFSAIPLVFYDSIYSLRLGFYFCVLNIAALLIKAVKKILGKTPFSFIISAIIFFAINESYLSVINRHGIASWNFGIFAKTLFNFIAWTLFLDLVFRLFGVHKGSENSQQLRF
jgi:hypothetical protein